MYLQGQGLPDDVYEKYDLVTLEDQLEEALATGEVGEYDGNEFGPRETVFYLYGPDASRLFQVIEPILRAYPLCQGARVLIRPGGPEAKGREIHVGG